MFFDGWDDDMGGGKHGRANLPIEHYAKHTYMGCIFRSRAT